MKADNKFIVLYSFKTIERKEDNFISVWTEPTKLIYKYEGSYGSRLHKVDKQVLIGYALWPYKETWKHSGTSFQKKQPNFGDKCVKVVLK